MSKGKCSVDPVNPTATCRVGELGAAPIKKRGARVGVSCDTLLREKHRPLVAEHGLKLFKRSRAAPVACALFSKLFTVSHKRFL